MKKFLLFLFFIILGLLILSYIGVLIVANVFNVSKQTADQLIEASSLIINVSIGYIFTCFVLLYIYSRFVDKNYYKNRHELTLKFIEDVKIREDHELLELYIKNYSELKVNTTIQDKPLIDYLIQSKRKETLKYFIKNGANITHYEHDIAQLLPLTYSIKNRSTEDYTEYFADRL